MPALPTMDVTHLRYLFGVYVRCQEEIDMILGVYFDQLRYRSPKNKLVHILGFIASQEDRKNPKKLVKQIKSVDLSHYQRAAELLEEAIRRYNNE